MCGIAGWIGTIPNAEGLAGRLLGALRHRGPDGSGFKEWPEASLVHTRLSIIDLSPAGAQPMANEDGTVWVVFNGEIYNHLELRHKLETKGHHFRGRSDSEILPHLYEEYGAGFVDRLSGMFAFAIYDTRRHLLLLVRDRFGIKPLFYRAKEESFLFASEINALREAPDFDAAPDPQAISDFAALCFIPAPETFFRSVRSLEPGECIEVKLEDGRIRRKSFLFHHWLIAPAHSLQLEDVVDRTDHLISAAVEKQLESDVALGSLLSGGIDSSLVSVAAQAASTRKLQTFNVRFPDKQYDETWAAEAVARQIGSQHTTLDMPRGAGTWDQVAALLQHAGQPFADTSLFPVNAVCRLMRRHITVALSGDGGDEAFGGYPLYCALRRISQLKVFPPWVWEAGSYSLKPLARLGFVRGHLAARVHELGHADNTAIIQSMWGWVRHEEHARLCHGLRVEPLRRLFERRWDHQLPKGSSRLETLSALATEANIRVILPNDYLFKVDCASMRESLEVRVPMLNEELVAFGLTLPHDLKVRGRQGKRVLRKVAERRLPMEVAQKRKMGFSIPVDVWADQEFKAIVKEKLLAPSSAVRDFFDPKVYAPWVEAFSSNGQYRGVSREGLYQRVVMLLAVELTINGARRAA